MKKKFNAATLKWMGAFVGGSALGGGAAGFVYGSPEFRERLTKSGAKTGAVLGAAAALGIHQRKEVVRAAKASANYIFRRVRGRVIPILVKSKLK